ncbi:MAG TPA: IPT/TIG domain-containing protein [Terriglobales bacterium]|nr:IPT/TIG domain-containing protein [Terriglobales bacterium]
MTFIRRTIAALVLAMLFPLAAAGAECANHCGQYVPSGKLPACAHYVWNTSGSSGCRIASGCYCDDACPQYGDCCSDYDALCAIPAISTSAPASVPTSGGAVVTLQGARLDGAIVQWDGQVLAPLSATYSRITFLSPPGEGKRLPVSVQRGAATSNVVYFDYLSPTIASLNATTAPAAGDVTLTISGGNFGSQPSVSIGDYPCNVSSKTHNLIHCTVSAGQGTALPLIVRTPAGVSNTVLFSYEALIGGPEVSQISPASGPTLGGTTLTINGSNFGTSGASVTIGPWSCPVSSQTPNQIICTTTSGSGHDLAVIVRVGPTASTNSVRWSYNSPLLFGISPSTGPTAGGTDLILTGANFGATDVTVRVDGAVCPITQQTHGSVTCTLPPGQGAFVPVQVSVDGRSSNTLAFSYASPSLDEIAPTSGAATGGYPLTLIGSNFGTSGDVTVGGLTCTPLSWSHSRIVCAIPRGSGSAPVIVSSSGRVSAALTFTYDSNPIPIVAGASPQNQSTAGGAVITIFGANFGLSGALPFVGGKLCSPMAQTDTTIQCSLPDGQGRGNPITVTQGQQIGGGAVRYDYGGPAITNVIPTSVATAGGTPLTIQGLNFGSTEARVTLGSSDCPVTSQSHGAITCTAPSGSGAGLPLTVDISGQTATTSVSYSLPTLADVSPSVAPAGTATTLHLTGDNFGPNTIQPIVTVGGTNCAVTHHTHAEITCTLPPGVGANLAVAVQIGPHLASPQLTVSHQAPLLESVAPASAPTAGGATLTIFGSNFGPSGLSSVQVGNVNCPITSASDSRISCTLPAGTGTAAVVVTAGGQASNSGVFRYDAPLITAISPTTGPAAGGALLTIDGSNFGNSLADIAATVDGNDCPIEELSDARITCTLPAGNGTQRIVLVRVALQTSNAVPFDYDAAAEAVSPSHGPPQGGTTITISGSGFDQADTYASIGGRDCRILTQEPTAITCVLPAGRGTDLDVNVTSAGSVRRIGGFDYDEPYCAPLPLSTCGSLPASSLRMSHPSAAEDRFLQWKWSNMPAVAGEFGDPTTTSSYVLCVYEDGVPVMQRVLLPGGVCQKKGCWTSSSRKLRYKDKSGSADGLVDLTISMGATSKVSLTGKGAGLDLPLPFGTGSTIIAQLIRDPSPGPVCWQATFAPPAQTNTPADFVDTVP